MVQESIEVKRPIRWHNDSRHLSDLTVCVCLTMSLIILTAICCDHFPPQTTPHNLLDKHLHSHSNTTPVTQQRGPPPPHLITVARAEWHWAVADAKAEPG